MHFVPALPVLGPGNKEVGNTAKVPALLGLTVK